MLSGLLGAAILVAQCTTWTANASIIAASPQQQKHGLFPGWLGEQSRNYDTIAEDVIPRKIEFVSLEKPRAILYSGFLR